MVARFGQPGFRRCCHSPRLHCVGSGKEQQREDRFAPRRFGLEGDLRDCVGHRVRTKPARFNAEENEV